MVDPPLQSGLDPLPLFARLAQRPAVTAAPISICPDFCSQVAFPWSLLAVESHTVRASRTFLVGHRCWYPYPLCLIEFLYNSPFLFLPVLPVVAKPLHRLTQTAAPHQACML